MNTIFCFCVYRVCWQGEERGWWKRGCGQDAKVWKNEKAGKQTSSLLSLTSWFSGELDRVAHGFRQVFSVVIADSHLQQVLCVGLQVLQLHPSCVHFLQNHHRTVQQTSDLQTSNLTYMLRGLHSLTNLNSVPKMSALMNYHELCQKCGSSIMITYLACRQCNEHWNQITFFRQNIWGNSTELKCH